MTNRIEIFIALCTALTISVLHPDPLYKLLFLILSGVCLALWIKEK